MIASRQSFEGAVVDETLIRKYDRPAPRYTSYPTALQFKPIDDEASVEAIIADAGEERGPISLYVHLPFCRSLCWFCGCTKVITSDSAKADLYLDYLEKEISLYRSRQGEAREAVQLHFGGGSPSFLTAAQIDRLAEIIHRHFAFAAEAEMSVEIDPRTLTRDKARAFGRLGINRASIGVQDIDERVQKAINRIQPEEMNRQAIEWLGEAGIHALNLDLVYGLPFQTVESFRRTLEHARSYDPDRFAVFSYAHVPWAKPSQKLLERSPLPTGDDKLKLLSLIVGDLTAAGYRHIGMDHFVKPEDPLALAQDECSLQRNFQGYSLFARCEIQAFGMSSISQSSRTYRQNVKGLESYYERLDEGRFPIERGYILNEDDRVRREVIMRVMCDMSLDYRQLGKALGIDFRNYFKAELASLELLQEDGLLELDDEGMKVSARGRFLIRNIALVFDAHLKDGAQNYSKSV